MKRLILAKFLVLILIGTLVGCANPKTLEPDLAVGKYVMEESEEIMKPTVSLEDGNKFTFNYSLLSSYFNFGSYEEVDDSLILKTDDGRFKYVFEIKNSNLIFNTKESSELPSYANVPDGATFSLNNELPE